MEHYNRYDSIYKTFQFLIAITVPIISLIDILVNGNTEKTSTVTTVFSSIVVFTIKFKDKLKYDKIKDIAKHQTVKYAQLYNKIEHEESKPENEKQKPESLLFSVTKDYNSIELADPDVTAKVMASFQKFCIEHNIQYDTDLINLQSLEDNVNNTENENNSTKDNIENNSTKDNNKNNDMKDNNAKDNIENNKEIKLDIIKSNIKDDKLYEKSNDEKQNDNIPSPPVNSPNSRDKNTDEVKSPNRDAIKSPNRDVIKSPNRDEVRSPNEQISPRKESARDLQLNTQRHRTPSEENEKKDYRNRIRTLNSKTDLNWALERLGNINN